MEKVAGGHRLEFHTIVIDTIQYTFLYIGGVKA